MRLALKRISDAIRTRLGRNGVRIRFGQVGFEGQGILTYWENRRKAETGILLAVDPGSGRTIGMIPRGVHGEIDWHSAPLTLPRELAEYMEAGVRQAVEERNCLYVPHGPVPNDAQRL